MSLGPAITQYCYNNSDYSNLLEQNTNKFVLNYKGQTVVENIITQLNKKNKTPPQDLRGRVENYVIQQAKNVLAQEERELATEKVRNVILHLLQSPLHLLAALIVITKAILKLAITVVPVEIANRISPKPGALLQNAHRRFGFKGVKFDVVLSLGNLFKIAAGFNPKKNIRPPFNLTNFAWEATLSNIAVTFNTNDSFISSVNTMYQRVFSEDTKIQDTSSIK